MKKYHDMKATGTNLILFSSPNYFVKQWIEDNNRFQTMFSSVHHVETSLSGSHLKDVNVIWNLWKIHTSITKFISPVWAVILVNNKKTKQFCGYWWYFLCVISKYFEIIFINKSMIFASSNSGFPLVAPCMGDEPHCSISVYWYIFIGTLSI